MNRLIINTANEELNIVLDKNGEVFSLNLTSKMHHNETMLPSIDKIIAENNLKIDDINEFGVVVGPGSFTGIRVGISTIKALRDALNVKAKGINNLDFLFRLAKSQNEEIETCAIKGSRDSYFVAKYINDQVFKYERNVNLEELQEISEGKQIAMFSYDEDVNCFVVDFDSNVLVQCLNESEDESLIPVYYQLSQAENEKLKRGEVEIEEAQVQDLIAISEIEKNNIKCNVIEKVDFDNMFINKNYRTYVAKFNNQVVGFILLQITDEINIVSIAVEKKYRNFGLGTALIKKSKELAKSLNLDAVSLEVSKNNINAYLLYLKNNFIIRRERKKYYSDGSDCFEMVALV